MNKWILGAVAAVSLTGCVSAPADKPVNPADTEFAQVYDAPGMSKGQIYEGTLKWIAENFKSAKSVIEYQNANDGVLIGNGMLNYPCNSFDCIGKAAWKVKFIMKVETKDGKFKTDFKNLLLDIPAVVNQFGSYPAMETPIQTQGDLDAVKPKLLEFGNQIKSSLTTDNPDW